MQREPDPELAALNLLQIGWQVIQTGQTVLVLDEHGKHFGTFRTISAAQLAVLAAEAGPHPFSARSNDNSAVPH